MQKKKSAEQLIEELAISVGKGFAATATKEDVASLANEMREALKAVEQRLDRVDFGTTGLSNRLEVIEDRVVQLAKKTGLKFN